jgi:hypothetical protein
LFSGFEFKLRTVGRRVVMGLVVNIELDMTEIRVQQLHKVVDIFVIQESNITFGEFKTLFELEEFNGLGC